LPHAPNLWPHRQELIAMQSLTLEDCTLTNDGRSVNIKNNSQQSRGPNVLILSAAGKPIFVRYGESGAEEGEPNEDEWATVCGVLQGMRANILSFGLSGLERGASSLGDIESITAGNRLIVFKHTEALMLVSISDRQDGNHNEAWLRLQLEYVYSQVLFTLTDQVQSIFERNPSYDLRTMMGPNEANSIRNLLDRFDPVDLDSGESKTADDPSYGSGCGLFLTAGVECIHPIPPEIRQNASKMLIHACSKAGSSPLFAILMVGTRLVTIVQPANTSSQLHTSDLHLVLTFVGRQPGLLTNELWFPICLPRFNSSGFLYAYTSCLDQVTGLSIVLLSADSSTTQFESFRSAANAVRKTLGLRSIKTKVLRVFDSSSNTSQASSMATPAKGFRNSGHDSADDLSGITFASVDSERRKTNFDDSAWKMNYEDEEEGYDEENSDDDEISIARRISARPAKKPPLERQLSQTCYLDNELQDISDEEKEKEVNHEAPLLTALRVAMSAKQQEEMMKSYLQTASAVHFVFRCDIFVQNGDPDDIGAASTGAMLTQCFGPPLSFPFIDASSQRHVWDVYQRLSLRLRLGSSSVEATMDALDMISETQHHNHYNTSSQSVSLDCPMQCLLESPPNVHSVTYLQEDNEWLFVGLNGKFFELYATLPATIPPKTGTAYCARLVRRLMGDERILFLSNPPTWAS